MSPRCDALRPYRFELVCVDDGSSDATLPQLLQLVERDARVRVLELSRNFGKEAALTAGIDAARGDAVIAMDADLQDPPELIGAADRGMVARRDVVLARRTDRSTDSLPEAHAPPACSTASTTGFRACRSRTTSAISG